MAMSLILAHFPGATNIVGRLGDHPILLTDCVLSLSLSHLTTGYKTQWGVSKTTDWVGRAMERLARQGIMAWATIVGGDYESDEVGVNGAKWDSDYEWHGGCGEWSRPRL